MNYHTRSDFRSERKNELDQLLTRILAVLMEKKLIDLYRVSQDGLRAATSERVNADVRTQRTLARFLVRGLDKVLTVALFNAVTFDIPRRISMRSLQ